MKMELKQGFWGKNDPEELKNNFEKMMIIFVMICIGNAIFGIMASNITITVINAIMAFMFIIIIQAKKKYYKSNIEYVEVNNGNQK